MKRKAKKRIRFGGEDNFIDSYEDSKVAILPIPYEKTTTYLKGTENGPEAILKASAHMELYDEELDSEIFRIGIYTLPPLVIKAKKPESSLKIIEKKVDSLLKDKKVPIILGGEHSISIAAVSAFIKRYHHLMVVQLDAHADLRDVYLGSRFNHACTMARIAEICPIVQIGIRSLSKEEHLRMKETVRKARRGPFQYSLNQKKGNWLLFASDMQGKEWIDRILPKINGSVYLTIDLDYFDPSLMPSVGTPEPGGGLWYPTLSFLKRLSRKAEIVGFDLVELCPQKRNPASDISAAKLAYKLIGYLFIK